MAAAARTSFTDRMIRAARLDAAVYEEVESDRTATTEAAMVVVLGAIAAGIGSNMRLGLVALVVVALLSLASWSFYAWLAYFFGGTVLKGPQTQTNWGEIARTLGFANAPRLLLILGLIPGFRVLLALAIPIWILVATVVALRAALVCGTARAIVVAVIASISQYLLTAVLLYLQTSA